MQPRSLVMMGFSITWSLAALMSEELPNLSTSICAARVRECERGRESVRRERECERKRETVCVWVCVYLRERAREVCVSAQMSYDPSYATSQLALSASRRTRARKQPLTATTARPALAVSNDGNPLVDERGGRRGTCVSSDERAARARFSCKGKP